ncbi:hypothetical protein [uncultured Senegalimassilia sp.]|uniref:hypothetical protein n=1 Tax=uncultured Senegalimassilia sp. TaxID=1714350 RepID=UPI0025EC9355|nr:hypothetical protein [uncultured Senegalimassilia sp.]
MYRRCTDGVPHPPLASEYEGADSGGVPDLFVSMPATCRDVSDELLDFMWYRGMSIPEVATAAGISEQAAEDLIQKGKGTSADLFALCDALRVELFSLPGDDEFERGME